MFKISIIVSNKHIYIHLNVKNNFSNKKICILDIVGESFIHYKRYYNVEYEVICLFGTVRWFNMEKGYGFIVYKDLENIFVHYSDIVNSTFKTLVEGQKVSFTLIESSKGLRAKKVYIIN